MHNLFLVVGADAAPTGFDVAAIIKAAAESVQGDLFSVLTVVVPIIAVVVGAVVAVKFGIKWLKSLGKA
mgnify:CR=1 FL=1